MEVSQRDAFIIEITKAISKNRKIYFLSADFGAPALDNLRESFPDNFVHCGISEQAMIDVATGLALENNIVFCYAMAPFISLRAIEQTKCGPGLMSLPICLISVGVGLGYADAGPTHYATEDFACLRSIPRSTVYTASDSTVAMNLANYFVENPHFSYVRLDRDALPEIVESTEIDIRRGYRIIGDIQSNSIALTSHGRMTHLCVEVQKEYPDEFFVIDIIRGKKFPDGVAKIVDECRGFIAVDEQSPGGSLFSAVQEDLSKKRVLKTSASLSLPDDYVFENGGRNYLLNKLGLNKENILNIANDMFL